MLHLKNLFFKNCKKCTRRQQREKVKILGVQFRNKRDFNGGEGEMSKVIMVTVI